MKATFKILSKCILIIGFLFITPFFSGLLEIFGKDTFIASFVYQQKTINEKISIKNKLNVLSFNSNITIPKATIKTEITTQDIPVVPQTPSTNKKIYIYNTHQSESYNEQETVMDAAVILGNQLKEKGIEVVLETNDFKAFGSQYGYNYNDSYTISRKFINDALVNYGGFDLIIDLHRDAIPREACFTTINNKNYAKTMSVVGGLSKNAGAVNKISSTLTDIMNQKCNGIMKPVLEREAYYNQQMNDRMILIELGGDLNTFEEVKNSIEYLSSSIAELVGR
ncbi:MAG: stage II sporulation protein P [Erysipelotrichaceae bacterium]